ncbi:MAG: LysR family transcriptional regulator [Calditrichaeota bacterium]|nr:LysR family transcriptional regulator [Calditrichota bacterium]
MNVYTLKIFCDVIDTSSFSEAAKLNFVTQSAVSQQINALEKKFDDALFVRNKNKFELTVSGSILYKYAREILELHDKLNEEISSAKDITAGKIRLSTIYSIGLHELPSLIKLFMKKYPHVLLHIEYARMDQVLYDVSNGSVDLGIVAFPKENHMIDILPFRKDRLVCIVGPDHRFWGRESINFNELNGERFVSFNKDIPTGKAVFEVFKEHGVEVETVMSFDNIETIKRAVEIDTGLSIVPKVTVRNEINLKTLHAVDFDNFTWERPLGIIVKKGKEPSSITKLLIEFLQKNKEPF